MDGRSARSAAAVVAAAIAVALGAGPAASARVAPPPPVAQVQPPAAPSDQPVFRSGVKLVLVDVSVTGNDDEPITDLTPDDFELTEDGVPQKVEQATLVQLDGQPRDSGEALPIRSQDHAIAEAGRDDVRVFAVFMDDYHLGRYPQEMLPLRKGLSEFLGADGSARPGHGDESDHPAQRARMDPRQGRPHPRRQGLRRPPRQLHRPQRARGIAEPDPQRAAGPLAGRHLGPAGAGHAPVGPARRAQDAAGRVARHPADVRHLARAGLPGPAARGQPRQRHHPHARPARPRPGRVRARHAFPSRRRDRRPGHRQHQRSVARPGPRDPRRQPSLPDRLCAVARTERRQVPPNRGEGEAAWRPDRGPQGLLVADQRRDDPGGGAHARTGGAGRAHLAAGAAGRPGRARLHRVCPRAGRHGPADRHVEAGAGHQGSPRAPAARGPQRSGGTPLGTAEAALGPDGTGLVQPRRAAGRGPRALQRGGGRRRGGGPLGRADHRPRPERRDAGHRHAGLRARAHHGGVPGAAPRRGRARPVPTASSAPPTSWWCAPRWPKAPARRRRASPPRS